MIDTAGIAASVEPQVTEEETLQVDFARTVVLAILRAVANMRFYLPNNPIVVRSKTEAYENIIKFLDTWGTMQIELTGAEMLYKGHSIYAKGDDKSRNMAFLFYRDGLRGMTFEKGLSVEELNNFLDIIRDTMNDPDEETDIVSALWNAAFEHLTYIAIEPFMETDDDTGDAQPFDEEPKRMTGRAYDNAESLTTAITPPQNEVPPSRRQSDPGRLLGTIDSEEIKKKIQGMLDFSPMLELGNILLDLLVLEENYNERKHLANLTVEYLKEMVSQRRFTEASETLSRVRLTLRYMASKDERYNELLDLMVKEMADFVSSDELKKSFKESFANDPQGVLALIEAVGPSALNALIELVPFVKDAKTKASIRTVLVTLAGEDSSKLKEAINSSNPEIAREAIAVVGRIGDSKSVQLLRPCVRSKHLSVRTQVLHSLAQIDLPQASRLTFEFLQDEDTDVRILAARTIDISKAKVLEQKMKDLIADRTFRLRMVPEKTAFIEALKKATTDDIATLLAPFFRRRLFRKQEDERVMLAVVATLSTLGTDATRKLLEKGSKSRRKSVALECLRALQQRTNGNQR
jgi:HEAT repeat protein